MNNRLNYKYFLFISLKKISLAVLDSENKNIFSKDIIINDLSIDDNLKTFDGFLKKNIFLVEKNLGEYVKEVFLIIDYDDIFSINLSLRYDFEESQFNLNDMHKRLLNIKNHFKKSISNHEIIHMMINKYIIDNEIYSSLPVEKNFNNLCLEIKFICLQDFIIQNLKEILSKYQISVNKILCNNYLKEFNNLNNQNIFNIAENIVNGLNQNEIFIINKSSKNKGFFEKFFEFFS